MVHYDPLHTSPTPPQVCPKCGSHRTEVVGITDSPPTLVLRCNACGAVSTVQINKDNAVRKPEMDEDVAVEVDVMRAVAGAMAKLSDEDARQRVLRWVNDRFQPSAGRSAGTGDSDRFSDDRPSKPGPGSAVGDPMLGVEGLAEFFDRAATPVMHREAVETDHALLALSVEELSGFFEPPVPAAPQSVVKSEPVGLDSLVRGFVSDFQAIALEWQGA